MANKTLYNYENEKEKEKKKKTKKFGKLGIRKKEEKSSNQIDSDNEIIIGVTVHNESKKVKEKANKKENKKSKKNKIKKQNSVETKIKKVNIKKENNQIQTKKQKIKRKIIKWTSIIVLLIGVILFAMLSPIFNIKKINVTGINKLTEEKVIGLSKLELEQNIFRINKIEIKKGLKQNGNVDTIEIKRHLPNEIEIKIQERIPSFEIEYGNGYAVISSQGYITEITDADTELPNLIGIETPEEEYKENNRLNEKDLNNLNLVLRIMNVASSNGIESLITSIDISNLNNISINFNEEKKVAYIGDCSNLSHRIQWVKTILESTKELEGEIIVNMNLNLKEPYFRERIK